MSSAIMFIGAIIATAAILTLVVFKSPTKAISYLKTPDGKKVLAGIAWFLVFGVVLAALSQCVKADGQDSAAEDRKEIKSADSGEWFAYGEVFIGVDRTTQVSPMCDEGGPDDRLTSNGGIRANVYQSADKRFEFNTKYTHHSCAFGQDNESYDAIGVEFTYRLW